MIDFDNDRRLQAVVFGRGAEIPKWALLQIFTALPSDALLFHVDFSFQRNEYHMVFWASEFDLVPIGTESPRIAAWVDTVNLQAGIGDMPPHYMVERGPK